MDRVAEIAEYNSAFRNALTDEDFLAAGYTPEEISAYRSQSAAPSLTDQDRAAMLSQYGTMERPGSQYEAPQGGYADIYRDSFLARNRNQTPTSVGFAQDYMDFLPIIGDIMAAGELKQELDKEDPNYPLAAALGVGTVAGAIPVVGDPLARGITRVARSAFDSPVTADVIGTVRGIVDRDIDFLLGRGSPSMTQGVGADVVGRAPVTFDDVERAMAEEAPATIPATPRPSGFENYLESVNPSGARVAAEDRPNLMMGDMYGMLPRNARRVGKQGDVTFYRGPEGDFYATAFNPDVGEQDVVGYIMPRGDMTELAVVGEMQGQGIGGELQYLFRRENPDAPTGGLTEAGERSLQRTYDRLVGEGVIEPMSRSEVAAFDVSRRDASSIFGEGTERVRYTDPQSGGTIEVVTRPDGSASVLELEVPEEFRGQGIGQRLQERVMQDFPMMGGQVSSKAAATTAYRLGRRPPGKPDATLEDVFAEIDEMSSVNMVSPEMQSRFGGATPPRVNEATTASEPRINVLGSAYGQIDASLTIPGIEGRIDYSVFDGSPKINMIEVPESARRQGNATKLLQALQDEFPGVEIDWGSLTEEGSALYQSTPFSEVPSQFSASFDELNTARRRLKNIQSRWDRMQAEGKSAPAGFFDEWQSLQDQIDDLEDQLRLERPTVKLIDTR